MLLWWFHSHTIHVPRWQREPKRYFGNKWAFSTGTVSNAGNMVEQHRETHGHDWTCSYDFCNRVDCQRFEKKKKKKIQNTHEIKRTLFNQTKQDGTCIFFFFFPGKPLFKLRTIIQQKTVEPTYHLPEQFMECGWVQKCWDDWTAWNTASESRNSLRERER